MINPKVLAYRHSQEENGKRVRQEEVEIIDCKKKDDVTAYLVKTKEGIVCTAIFNPFTCCYYADDVYGIVENYSPKRDFEM